MSTNIFHHLLHLLQWWPLSSEVAVCHISCVFDHIVGYVYIKVLVIIPASTAIEKLLGTMRGVKQMAKIAEQFLPAIKDCHNRPLHDDVLIVNATS